MLRRFPILLLLIAGSAGALENEGGTPNPPPAADNSLGAQIQRLTRTVLEQERQIRHLENEIRELRGSTETLAHEIDKERQSGRGLYSDMESRLSRLEKRGAPPPLPAANPPPPAAALPAYPPAASVPAAPAGVVTEQTAPPPAAPIFGITGAGEEEDYQKAFQLLQSGAYDEAVAAFQGFLSAYPRGSYADNAQYWLGEAHYAKRDYQKALAEFNRLLENYPDSEKRSHALLKTGYVYQNLNDRAMARRIFENVREQYAGTATARLAGERLRMLQAEGY